MHTCRAWDSHKLGGKHQIPESVTLGKRTGNRPEEEFLGESTEHDVISL